MLERRFSVAAGPEYPPVLIAEDFHLQRLRETDYPAALAAVVNEPEFDLATHPVVVAVNPEVVDVVIRGVLRREVGHAKSNQ